MQWIDLEQDLDRQTKFVHPTVLRAREQVEKDEEGMETMKKLGENMAWLLKKLEG